MGQPITTTAGGICFAFPDVCLTPIPGGGSAPVPYPNIGQLSGATGVASTVLAGGNPVVTQDSTIPTTTGDEAGSLGGVTSGAFGQKVEFATFSGTVKAEGAGVVRMFDTTQQNNRNAVGRVLGGVPTVLVGG
ncbi:MAG: DUF4150 domain-containing protein [Chloroflexi bacterium]|nr:DUF4150 domain-containing protein [Chloroflexota bacterium]